jgi:hypothetical protein
MFTSNIIFSFAYGLCVGPGLCQTDYTIIYAGKQTTKNRNTEYKRTVEEFQGKKAEVKRLLPVPKRAKSREKYLLLAGRCDKIHPITHLFSATACAAFAVAGRI